MGPQPSAARPAQRTVGEHLQPAGTSAVMLRRGLSNLPPSGHRRRASGDCMADDTRTRPSAPASEAVSRTSGHLDSTAVRTGLGRMPADPQCRRRGSARRQPGAGKRCSPAGRRDTARRSARVKNHPRSCQVEHRIKPRPRGCQIYRPFRNAPRLYAALIISEGAFMAALTWLSWTQLRKQQEWQHRHAARALELNQAAAPAET